MKTTQTIKMFFLILSFGIILNNQVFANGCNPEQEKIIEQSEINIKLRLHELNRDWPIVNLIGVKRIFVEKERREWISRNPKHADYQNYWNDMNFVWKQMNEKFSKVSYSCKSLSTRKCKKGEVLAYVLFLFGKPQPVINLCPVFFVSEKNDQDATIFHELSHYAASTEDYGKDWSQAEHSDLSRASRDAYHIEDFMNEDIGTLLRRQIWAWWWPRTK